MGLEEKRAVKEYQEQHYPQHEQAIREAAGFDVEIEVDWSSLAVEKYSKHYTNGFTKIFFEPLVGALQAICADDMGREALQEALKKVVICNSADQYGTKAFTFEDGVLKADHHPVTNIDEVQQRTDLITKLLESKL